jgi:hypothetical protein
MVVTERGGPTYRNVVLVGITSRVLYESSLVVRVAVIVYVP